MKKGRPGECRSGLEFREERKSTRNALPTVVSKGWKGTARRHDPQMVPKRSDSIAVDVAPALKNHASAPFPTFSPFALSFVSVGTAATGPLPCCTWR